MPSYNLTIAIHMDIIIVRSGGPVSGQSFDQNNDLIEENNFDQNSLCHSSRQIKVDELKSSDISCDILLQAVL